MENLVHRKKISILSCESIESLLCIGPALTALKKSAPESEVGIATSLDWFEITKLFPEIDFVQEPCDLTAESTFNLDVNLHTFDTKENGQWKNYLESTTLPWKINPYHAIDIHRRVVGLENIDVNYEFNPLFQCTESIENIFSSVDPGSLKILLDCDSFEKDVLLEIISGMIKTGLPICLFLIGTLRFRKEASGLQKAGTGTTAIINLLGKTSVLDQASTAKKVDLCICGPGLTALMASGFGTFTYCVDSQINPDPLYYPYGHGHLIIQPCRSAEPKLESRCTLAGFITELLQYTVRGNNGGVPTSDQWTNFFEENFQKYFSSFRVFVTQRVEFSSENQTNIVDQFCKPLCYMGAEAKDIYGVFYRLLWEYCLSDRVHTTNELEILHDSALIELKSELTRAQQLCEVATFGVRYSALLATSYKNGSEASSATELAHIDDVNKLILQIAEDSLLLAPLALYHANAVSRLNNFTPELSARMMQETYSYLQSRTVLLLDLVKDLFHNYKETKPTTIGIL